MKESAYRDMRMESYYVVVQKLEDKFDSFEIHHVLRWDNEEADTLAKVPSIDIS